ncbi:MAG: hypothetical protein ABW328_06265 [Ilumatobacteraceae bacterium]
MAHGRLDADSAINVTMDDGSVVISPTRPLDDAALDALRSLVDGARAAGVRPVVDLGALRGRDRAAVVAVVAALEVSAAGPGRAAS